MQKTVCILILLSGIIPLSAYDNIAGSEGEFSCEFMSNGSPGVFGLNFGLTYYQSETFSTEIGFNFLHNSDFDYFYQGVDIGVCRRTGPVAPGCAYKPFRLPGSLKALS